MGLEYRVVRLTCMFCALGWVRRRLILAGEPVEDRSAANFVVDEVDHTRRMGLGLDWCKLPKRPVWPRGVEMVQVGREDSA